MSYVDEVFSNKLEEVKQIPCGRLRILSEDVTYRIDNEYSDYDKVFYYDKGLMVCHASGEKCELQVVGIYVDKVIVQCPWNGTKFKVKVEELGKVIAE